MGRLAQIKRAACAVASLLFVMRDSAAHTQRDLPDPARARFELAVGSHRCSEGARALLKAWHARGPWTPTIPQAPGDLVFRGPSGELGKWVEATVSHDFINLVLFTRTGTIGTTLSPNATGACRAQARLHQKPAKGHLDGASKVAHYSILRDDGLAALMSDGRAGVLYLWSPHKPISVEGLRSMKEATGRTGVRLFAVVEPTSDPRAVERTARRLKLRTDQVLYLDSFELQQRGFRLHFPSLLIFDAGVFASQVRRGYEFPDVYEDYLKTHLAKERT